jgi:hypothetical protein
MHAGVIIQGVVQETLDIVQGRVEKAEWETMN